MPDILTDFSKASAAHAVEANLFSFFQQLNDWARIDVRDDGECIWTISDLPFPLFNSVLRARVDDQRLDELIALRMQACRDRGVPMLWWTGPSTAPADLGDRLARLGFMNEPADGMVAYLDDSRRHAPTGVDVSIERVRDRATLDAWTRVLCDGFGAPRSFGDAFAEMAEAMRLDVDSSFRHYLARLNGEPVATCSMFLGAGVAGLYDIATIPSRRRGGIGAAITRHAMQEARSAGYRVAILHASHLGAGVYHSLGFETICEIGQHVWTPENFTRS